MQAVIKNIPSIAHNGGTLALTIELDSRYSQEVYNAVSAISASDKPYILTIEKQKKKRSLNANAYCWTLCQKIAERVGTTKEVVYRKNIREVGGFTMLEMQSKAVPRFIETWQSNGIGWFAEQYGEKYGFAMVAAYYGSSQYDTQEMSRLIDALVEEAKSLGIETMSPEEVERMKTSWTRG